MADVEIEVDIEEGKVQDIRELVFATELVEIPTEVTVVDVVEGCSSPGLNKQYGN